MPGHVTAGRAAEAGTTTPMLVDDLPLLHFDRVYS